MATVLVWFHIKSFLKTAWSVFATVFTSFNTSLQAEGLVNVFSTTTTPSKPVRSKAGVLLRSTLRYGKAEDTLVG